MDHIEEANRSINAVVTVNDSAIEQAYEAERALVVGNDNLGPLHGVPFTAKEVFNTAGVRTTRGSVLYSDHVPKQDATAVKRLKDAGAILIGKTNCPEFALSAETVNDLFGRTVSPWSADHTSGGSSGGEAAAIVARMSPLGIGTDLGGSNRLPSHYNNIVGLKGTHGRIPLTGSWPELMSRRMHVGPMARTVRDVALGLMVMSGPDGEDPYALGHGGMHLPTAHGSLEELLRLPKHPLRVAYFSEGPFYPVMGQIKEVVERAATFLDEEVGYAVEEISPNWEDMLPIDVTMSLLVVEASHYFASHVSGRETDLSDSITGLLGSPMPSMDDYMVSLDKHEALSRDVTRILNEYDLILCPTSPTTSPRHDSVELVIDGYSTGAGHAANITAAFGMTGHPAISIPFGMSSDGLPIGVQLVTGHMEDTLLLQVSAAVESASETRGVEPPSR